jgi:hypothetical protein
LQWGKIFFAMKAAWAASFEAASVRAVSIRPIHDQCRNAKNPQGHRGHDVKLSNDPNAKDAQWLAASGSSEIEHDDSNQNQNKTAREIHGSFSNP